MPTGATRAPGRKCSVPWDKPDRRWRETTRKARRQRTSRCSRTWAPTSG